LQLKKTKIIIRRWIEYVPFKSRFDSFGMAFSFALLKKNPEIT